MEHGCGGLFCAEICYLARLKLGERYPEEFAIIFDGDTFKDCPNREKLLDDQEYLEQLKKSRKAREKLNV